MREPKPDTKYPCDFSSRDLAVEVAQRWGVDRTTVYRMADEGG